MVLIVDSGSTKSEWSILNRGEAVFQQELEGISPFFHSEEEVARAFRQIPSKGVLEIHYYGTGCSTGPNRAKIHLALKKAFPEAQLVEVDSDIMGAARGLCQHTPGIAAILGTGSNSCVFDGNSIIEQHGGLGYILGDEGSGAVLGKMLMQDFLNHKLPAHLEEVLTTQYNVSRDLLLHKVYKESLPNRYLASFAPVVHHYRQDAYIQKLLARHFGLFFENLASAFSGYTDLPLHLTGSVAWYFKDEVLEACKAFPFTPGTIMRSPTAGLIRFHHTP
ncbi:MAG: hypothetical protein H6558_14730 [Lewinellaceae bacterium]|nr:hypothetical protein [Lewinellaceae bacterium]